jgi:hypothetical protein
MEYSYIKIPGERGCINALRHIVTTTAKMRPFQIGRDVNIGVHTNG